MEQQVTNFKRTDYCGNLNKECIGKKVTVCGWVQRQRDLGQLIFIDLRDKTGIVQLAFDDNTDKDIFSQAFKVRAEFVLAASGTVRERSSKNYDIPTGEIEIEVEALHIFSKSETPPFEICENTNVNEELRLKYRYLDLRRPDLQRNIIFRHKIVKSVRDYFDDNDFVEIETPLLIKSTPEGARDYLVPSRVFGGSFFALPQSPQLYKQLCMLSGFDRYMQVAKCFRDEDLRADRQPEFTQIDYEMSFADENDIMGIAEGLVQKVYKDVLDIDIKVPFDRMTYDEAMRRFGSDKPDTRFAMEIVDLTENLAKTDFKVFANSIKNGGVVAAINAKAAANSFTRKDIDKLGLWIKDYKAKGLAWSKFNEDGNISSSFEKFLSDEEITAMHKNLDFEKGDLIFVVADENINVAQTSLGALRCKLAKQLGIIDKTKPSLLWVTEFPMFEYSEEENRYVSKHHPFTMPLDNAIDRLQSEPASAKARAYDMILNGNELGGGSIRISDSELQKKVLKALGFTEEEAQERFGFLMDAFKYGAPPHGGLAFGLDRLVMLMLDCESIRDVIAFPKVQNSSELMSSSPAPVDRKQLEELSIKFDKK